MPGSTPPISQLDWLISTTAMIVLSWSRATRDLLKSFGWGIRALHQLGCSDDGAISSSPAPYHLAGGLVAFGPDDWKTFVVVRTAPLSPADFSLNPTDWQKISVSSVKRLIV